MTLKMLRLAVGEFLKQVKELGTGSDTSEDIFIRAAMHTNKKYPGFLNFDLDKINDLQDIKKLEEKIASKRTTREAKMMSI